MSQVNGTRILTDYFTCNCPEDFEVANTFLKDTPFKDQELWHPTILAARGGKIIGLLGTIPCQELVHAGPVVIKTEQPIFVMLKLVDHYERELMKLGIKNYSFFIETGDKKFRDAVERALQVKGRKYQGKLWYRRDLWVKAK